MKKLVVFSGAGISAESGLGTFRDKDGLWDKYAIEDVATYEAWERNPKRVLDFYNLRRNEVLKAIPNPAHFALSHVQEIFDTTIITQNIDDLHERAGSKKVLHLHGEILFGKSSAITKDHQDLIKIEKDLILGDVAEDGAQLRPHVVWFGEEVPNMSLANEIVSNADIFIIVGTSLNVYPAANLIYHVPERTAKYIIDKKRIEASNSIHINHEIGSASMVLPKLIQRLISTN